MRLNSQAFVRSELDTALKGYAYKGEPQSVEVRVTVPNPRPEFFVLARREGGGRMDAHRDRPGIGVFVWAPTEAAAYDLILKVSEVMFSLEHKPGIASVEEETLTSAPDPEDKNPRWYASYTLITYETKE